MLSDIEFFNRHSTRQLSLSRTVDKTCFLTAICEKINRRQTHRRVIRGSYILTTLKFYPAYSRGVISFRGRRR